jgi:hypothetical protein
VEISRRVTTISPSLKIFDYYIFSSNFISTAPQEHRTPKMKPSQDKIVKLEEISDQEVSSISTDLGDASGFIGHGEVFMLDEKASRKLLWKIGKTALNLCLRC